MPQNWKTYNWGDISELKYGKGLKGYRELVGDIPVFGTNGYIGQTEKPLCTRDGIIVGRKGAYRGIHYSPEPFFVIDTAYYLLSKIKDLDIKYAYYQLLTQDINGLDSGSAIPSTSREDFYRLKIDLPPIQEQTAIASILSAVDDKIELNLQMNKTLEEMAMALYKHWFVDFGPFQNGEFVDSELGKIPKGWEVKKLTEFATLIMGQSPKSEFYNDDGEGLPFHQGVKDYGIRFPNDNTYSTAGNRLAEEGEILFSVRAPVGRLNIAKNKIILGRGLASISLKDNNSFMFYALKTMFSSEDIIGSGTVFNSVNKTDLQNLEFVVPEVQVFQSFKDLVEPLDAQYFTNSIQNQTLTKLRDTLLPKLISGEVRVKDIEKTISEVL